MTEKLTESDQRLIESSSLAKKPSKMEKEVNTRDHGDMGLSLVSPEENQIQEDPDVASGKDKSVLENPATDPERRDQDLQFGTRKKRKKKTPILLDSLEREPHLNDSDDTMYSYVELLKRLLSNVKESQLQREKEQIRDKLVLPIPVVVRSGRLRTTFVNFQDTIRSLHRPPHHFLAFINSELGTVCSVSATNQLWIKGAFKQQHISKIISDYAKNYVLCPACKSPETLLRKNARLTSITCDRCDAKFTVNNITNGYRANVHIR